MTKKIILLLAVVTLTALSSCVSPKDLQDENVLQGYDSGILKNGEGIDIKSLNVIRLEETNKSMLSGISKVEILDTLIVVLDEIYGFKKDGSYSHGFGKKGNGHGEYNHIGSFCVDRANKKLIVIDDTKSSLLFFDYNGKLLDTKQYDSGAFFFLSNAEYADGYLFMSCFMYKDYNAFLKKFDISSGETVTLSGYGCRSKDTAEITGRHAFSVDGNTVSYVLPFTNKIQMTDGKDITERMEIQTEKPVLTYKEIEEITDFNMSYYDKFRYSTPAKFSGFTDIFETSSHILLSCNSTDYFLIDKANNKGTLHDYEITDFNKKTLPLINIMGSYEDCLIGVLTADDVLYNPNVLRAVPKLGNDYSAESNPVLLIYQLD